MSDTPDNDANGYNSAEFSEGITVTKGLSKLQRQILALALHNHQAGPRENENGPRLYYAEILHGCFGWEPMRDWQGKRTGLDRKRFGKVFSKEEMGGREYNTARAAVSRSLRRLVDRGLVEIGTGVYAGWSAIRLTESGLAAAERL